MNERIKMFLIYAEHHSVEFNILQQHEVSYCRQTTCTECALRGNRDKMTHILKSEDMIFLKEKHPELFI